MSVTLDLDAIARDAAALGWTVGWSLGRLELQYTRRVDSPVYVSCWPDGDIFACVDDPHDGDLPAPWAVVGPLYALIAAHATEG